MTSNNDLICQFCNTNFKRKYNLIFHQKNTKSCLEKQGKINETYKCVLFFLRASFLERLRNV